MTTPTPDPATVLARVPCPECGHVIRSHYEGCNESGCCCPTGFGDIAAAHIAATEERLSALEARVAGDEALLYRAVSVLGGTDGRELLLRDMHARLGRKEPQ